MALRGWSAAVGMACLALWGGLGCGSSEGATDGASGSGPVTAGASGGPAGSSGTSSAGSSSAGGASGSGGLSAGGTTGQPMGGSAPSSAGETAGGAGGLLDCDPRKILCKRLAPECQPGSVPSVAGSCYGPCVKVESCLCAAAEQCPEPNQYTCWAMQHCGPYVE